MQTFIHQRREPDGVPVDVTVDDQTEILADFESGASGTILASWAGTGHKCDLGFEVIGSRGSVAFGWQRSNELQFFDAGDPVDRQGFRTILVGPAHPGADGIHTVAAQGLGYTDAFTIAARNTLRNLAAGTVMSGPTFVDGLRVAEVTDAVIAAVGQRIHAWPSPAAPCESVGQTETAQVVEAGLGIFQAPWSSIGSHDPARSCRARRSPSQARRPAHRSRPRLDRRGRTPRAGSRRRRRSRR